METKDHHSEQDNLELLQSQLEFNCDSKQNEIADHMVSLHYSQIDELKRIKNLAHFKGVSTKYQ